MIAKFATRRVKSYVRKGKLVRSFLRNVRMSKPRRAIRKLRKAQPERERKKSNSRKAILFGAAAVGLPASAFLIVRHRYRSNFEKTTAMAIEQAKSIDASIKPKHQHIFFTAGGLSYKDSSPGTMSGERLGIGVKRAFSDKRGNDFKMVPIDSSESMSMMKDIDRPGLAGRVKAVGQYFGNNLRRGYNPTAVSMAANVIAYGDKYPDKPLIMTGHSAGGLVTHEAQEIIRRARPSFQKRLTTINFSSEYFGVTQRFGKSITLSSPNDPVNRLPMRDRYLIPSVNGHNQSDYLTNPDVQNFVKRLIYGNRPVQDKAKMKRHQSKLAEFRRRSLSRQHRQKISRALKGRSRNQLKERVVRVREAEARARNARNLGYLTNAVSQGVREARLTARWLGYSPRQRSSYRGTLRDVNLAVKTSRGIQGILRI